MTLWIDVKYLQLISSRLDGFKKKDSNLWTCRCPICLDSQKNKRKTRGYIYEKEGSLLYHCHNCSLSLLFRNFLKRVDPRLFNEYKVELISHDKNKSKDKFIPEKKTFDSTNASYALVHIPIVDKLQDHPAKKYLTDRQLPLDKFRYVDNFMHWVNTIVPKKFNENALKYDEGRIIIPFFNRDSQFFAFQGRSIKDDAQIRYISINLDETQPMIYGLEKVNFNHEIYVTEGPLDSLFINNSVAIAGSNFPSLTKLLPVDRLIMAWDNEPNNRDTVKKMRRSIESGLKIVIWPDNIFEKDINKMIISGMSPDYIQYLITNNTFSGMKAQIRLNNWSKCGI